MGTMTRCLGAALVVSLVVPLRLEAHDHVVTRDQIAVRLEAARADRAAHQRRIDALLTRWSADDDALARAIEASGVRARVATLSDDEVRALAVQADALDVDPVAAGSTKTVVIIVVVVILVALLWAAIKESCREQGAECFN